MGFATPAPAEMAVEDGEVEMKWEVKTDPVEAAFSIDLPEGWRNTAYLVRQEVRTTPMATSESPDGKTALFHGDPKIPLYVEPRAALPQQRNDPAVAILAYTPATELLPRYLQRRFGKLPGFKLGDVERIPYLEDAAQSRAEEGGYAFVQFTPSAAF